MQGNPDFPPKHRREHKLLPLPVALPCPPHAYATHVHTDKQAQCYPSRDHSPVCGGGTGTLQCFLVSAGWEVAGEIYQYILFQPTNNMQHISKLPPAPQCVSYSAQLTSLSRKPSRFAPQWPFATSVPSSAHIAAALAQGIEHSVGKGSWDNR